MLLIGLAAQIGQWQSEIGSWVAVFLAAIVSLWAIWLGWTWHQSWTQWKPLSVGRIAGGLSVETGIRLYEWEAITPIQNEDDERPAMTKEIYLMIRRGKRVMRLRPKEPQELTFAPGEPKTVTFHFESAGGLEPLAGERETEQYEYATVVIVDSHGNKVEEPLGSGEYSTNL
jgi:hypothetical protein